MRRSVLRYVMWGVLVMAIQVGIYAVGGFPILYLVNQAFVAVGATLFTVVYHATARWWESPIGRNIMLLVGSIAAILDLGLAFNLLGRPDWMRWLFAFLFLCIGLAIWRRLGILIDAQYHTPDVPKS